jgi:hypothetical protein
MTQNRVIPKRASSNEAMPGLNSARGISALIGEHLSGDKDSSLRPE